MSSILIRRANMVSGGNSPRLPAGYTELEYIESSGTQWIDTGIGYTVYYKTYLIALGIAAVGWMAWPKIKEIFEELKN